MDVVRKIVNKNICVGCGVCSASCPHDAISMVWNDKGEIVPEINSNCTDCGLCLETCPFNFENENTSSLTASKFGGKSKFFDSILGYYDELGVGYVTDEELRKLSASGGLASYFQYKLIEEDYVDYVVNVVPTEGLKEKFMFSVHSVKEDIYKGKGSAYYPVTMGNILSFIAENEGRYMVIALPCFLKGLELLKGKNKIFRERIVFTFGLVCGQLKSAAFARNIANSVGVSDYEYEKLSVNFRYKVDGETASDFMFRYFYPFSEKEYFADWKEKVDFKWGSDLYTIPACKCCDDVFAECADMVFMDAWLPKYVQDNKGYSIVISRNPKLTELLKIGVRDSEIKLEDISLSEVHISQDNVIRSKQELLKFRLRYIFKEFNGFVRIRRGKNIKLSHKAVERLKIKILKSSRENRNVALGFYVFLLKSFKSLLKFVSYLKSKKH